MLSGATVRHRLSALSSLFDYLYEKNAVTHDPVKGVKRPKPESGEGKTPANWRRPGPRASCRARRTKRQGEA
jgi:site-specific recombinase XerC